MSKLVNSRQGFLSTREAAARLGVALSTVQAWVEAGTLPAWKTAGGHRRIPEEAVTALLERQRSALGAAAPRQFKVLVVEDEPVQRELYVRQFAAWQLPVQMLMAEDGFEGLLLIGRHSPDLIITDLAMPEMDGFKMIRRLKSRSSTVSGSLIVVTALTPQEIESHGGLPPGIPVYHKPVPFAALRPVVEHLASKQAA